MKSQAIFILSLCTPLSIWAAPETESDRQFNKTIQQVVPQTPEIAAETFSGSLKELPKEITFTDVQQNPQLSEPLLNQALNRRDYATAEQLLSIYRQWNQSDPILVDFAQGAIWRGQGKHKQAIALYQNILQKNPHLVTVRLDLAAMLFENQQLKDAKTQFQVAKKIGLPEEVLPRINSYEQSIANQQKWQFSGSLSYTRDDNLNNVSAEREIRLPQFGNLPFAKDKEYLPQKGQGISYHAAAERDLNVGGNHHISMGASVDGSNYWDNHDYDDVSLRGQLGYAYKDLHNEIRLLPFAEKRWYSGDLYYNRAGVDSSISRWLNTKWRVSANGTLAWKDYANERNGRDAQISVGINYLLNHKTYVFGGLNYGRDKVYASPRNSSQRQGGYIGLGQTWGKFNSRVVLNRYNESYDGNHYIYTNTRRHDRVFNSNISLSHQSLKFWDITPRLNWRYTKVKSNIDALHSYDKHKWFVDFEKRF